MPRPFPLGCFLLAGDFFIALICCYALNANKRDLTRLSDTSKPEAIPGRKATGLKKGSRVAEEGESTNVWSLSSRGTESQAFLFVEDHGMSKQKILVVEDEVSLLKLESILLTTRGYQVFSMKNGKDALECIEKETPDLVLLDVMLPGVDGFEVCRQIKSNPLTSHILVILLTAKKTQKDVAMGKEVKADCYITKPFQSAMVMETIQRLLKR